MTDNLPAFDELNEIRTTISGEMTEMLARDKRIDRRRCEDIIFELITMGYVYGIEVAGLDLEEDLPVDAGRMKDVAWKRTAGENFSDRIDTHIKAFEESAKDEAATRKLAEQLSVIAETETHRAINTGEQDGAQEYADTHRKETVFKTWVTMQDDRVREQHDLLDGATVPLNARFYSWTGDSARFPGDFVSPELNINCRCLLRFTKR